jgi:tetratricopeptide (TPR) repeat protein
LGDDATVMGPYAQTVTLGTNKKAEIYYFGAYKKADSLFEIIPATHVIYEIGMGGNKSGNEIKFAEFYSKIDSGSVLIDSYLIGRYYVNLYNITQNTNNQYAKSYAMTDFEKGMYYYNKNMTDSASAYLIKVASSNNFRRAALYLGNIYYGQGKYDRAKIEYEKGLADDCYDPKFWALYGLSCRQLGDIEAFKKAKQKTIMYSPFPGYFQNLAL